MPATRAPASLARGSSVEFKISIIWHVPGATNYYPGINILVLASAFHEAGAWGGPMTQGAL
jgi:hypothetical protein